VRVNEPCAFSGEFVVNIKQYFPLLTTIACGLAHRSCYLHFLKHFILIWILVKVGIKHQSINQSDLDSMFPVFHLKAINENFFILQD